MSFFLGVWLGMVLILAVLIWGWWKRKIILPDQDKGQG